MKSFKTILMILALMAIKTLNASSNSNSSLSKKELILYYNKDLNLLTKETCVKLYNLSQQILKDETVRLAQTPLMKEFKSNITNFQEDYHFYMRYGFNAQVLLIFAHMTINYYYQELSANKDSEYILQLIKKLGYDEILDEFENKFMKFVLNDYLPKVEEFQNHTSLNETKKLPEISKWVQELKKCKIYKCFHKHTNSLDNIFRTAKELLLVYINEEMRKINIFYSRGATAIAKSILESDKLVQLSGELRRKLIFNLRDYIRKAENSSNPNDLYNSIMNFYENVLLQFYNSPEIPLNERQLLINIFDQSGYVQFNFNYQKKFREFAVHDLVQKFEHFKNSLSREELLKENKLLNWFDNFKSLTTHDERSAALESLFAMNENNNVK